jgi:hypothetical protein
MPRPAEVIRSAAAGGVKWTRGQTPCWRSARGKPDRAHCRPPYSCWSGWLYARISGPRVKTLLPRSRRLGIADRRPPMMPGPARYAKPPRLAALNRTANAGHQSRAHPWSGPVEHIPPHSGDRARSIVQDRDERLKGRPIGLARRTCSGRLRQRCELRDACRVWLLTAAPESSPERLDDRWSDSRASRRQGIGQASPG